MQSKSSEKNLQSKQNHVRLPSARPRSTAQFSSKYSNILTDSKYSFGQLPPPLMPSTAHLHKIKKVPQSLQDVPGINSKELNKGQRLYLHSIAHCYNIVSTKTRLQQGYYGLLLKQYNTGLYTKEEYRRYIEWIFGDHKRLYKVDPMIWRSPSPPRTPRPQTRSSFRVVKTKAQKEHPVPILNFKHTRPHTANHNSFRDPFTKKKKPSHKQDDDESNKSSLKSTSRETDEIKVVSTAVEDILSESKDQESFEKESLLGSTNSDGNKIKDVILNPEPALVHDKSLLGSTNSDDTILNPEPALVRDESLLGSTNSDDVILNPESASVHTESLHGITNSDDVILNPESASVHNESLHGSTNSDDVILNPESASVHNESLLECENFDEHKTNDAVLKNVSEESGASVTISGSQIELPQSSPPEYLSRSLKTFTNFNVEADCHALRTAMKGLGTDEKAIINILAYRDSTQRVEIKLKFKSLFGKDLEKELESELSGNFNTVCQNLMLNLAQYDAKELRKAMKGIGTDEKTLIEILSSRNNTQLNLLKETYAHMFPGRALESDLISETSGQFKRLLISLVQGHREDNQYVDSQAVQIDARRLFEAGKNTWAIDDSVFFEILCTRSEAHLQAVFFQFHRLSSKTIEETIKSEMSGDLCKGMLAIVSCMQNKFAYFAQELYDSMAGLGTNDDNLIRIIISRCEIDMVQIKDEFKRLYGKTLASFIKGDTSGDYKNMLLALIGELDS